jgi:hypothetical protein
MKSEARHFQRLRIALPDCGSEGPGRPSRPVSSWIPGRRRCRRASARKGCCDARFIKIWFSPSSTSGAFDAILQIRKRSTLPLISARICRAKIDDVGVFPWTCDARPRLRPHPLLRVLPITLLGQILPAEGHLLIEGGKPLAPFGFHP